MQIFANSDIGRARELNEDFYYVSSPEDEIKLFILADGMGGYNGGEIASRLAVETLREYIIKHLDIVKSDREEIKEMLRRAIKHTNGIVYKKAKENRELEGMGTTIDVVLIINNKLFIGHVRR